MKNRLFKIIWMNFKLSIGSILTIWIIIWIGSMFMLWRFEAKKIPYDTFLDYYYYELLIFLFLFGLIEFNEDLSKKKIALFSPYYYMLPISTLQFASLKVISTISIIISGYAGMLSFNYIFVGSAAPIIAPILFISSFYILNQGIEYIIGKIRSLFVVFILLIDIPLFFWFGRRFGAPFIVNPTHMWNVFTLNEFLFLFSIWGLGYILQIIGIEKDRRGEAWGIKAPSKAIKSDMRSFPLKRYNSHSSALFHFNWKRGGVKKAFSGEVYYWTLPYKDMDMAFAIMKSGAMKILILSAILTVPIFIFFLFFFKGMWDSWKNSLPFLLSAFYLIFFLWILLMWIHSFFMKSPIYLKIGHILSYIILFIFIPKFHIYFFYFFSFFYFLILFITPIASFIESYHHRLIRLSGIITIFILCILIFLLTNYLLLPWMDIGPFKSFWKLSFLIGFILLNLSPFGIIPLGVYYTRHR